MTAKQWQGPAVNPWNSQGTAEITCPRCDYEFHDSWEYCRDQTDEDVECPNCELEFIVEVDYSVTYTSNVRTQE